jgi:phosphatidylinositol alpha-mannosyltransferase
MGNLRIGLVTECYYPTLGGIQEHVRHLRNYLGRQGIDVTVLTGSPAASCATALPGDAEDHVVRLGKSHRFRTGGTFTQATLGPVIAARWIRQMRRGRFDLLNIHGPCDLGLATLALSLYRGPKVLTLHSCFPDAQWRRRVSPYYRWVFRRAASVIAVSQATAQSMGRYADFPSTIIPNGVDVDYWPAAPSSLYQLPGFRNLVFVGRLEERNGPDLAIAAFARVAAQLPDVRLLMAGDGPMRPALEQSVPRHLRDRVVFLGPVYDERPALLASASLFLLPARAVGFSILVLEAFAARLPVVALPALGTDRAGSHWSNVLLSHDESPEAYAIAIMNALASDQRQRIETGLHIAKEHDWSRVGGKILKVFEQVVAAKKGLLATPDHLAA